MKIDWRGSLWPPERPHLPSTWQPWLDLCARYGSYGMLVVSVALSLVFGTADRLSLGVAAVALVWIFLTVTLPPERLREHPVFAAVNWVGFTVLASVLEARDVYYLIFMIMAFILAMRLRPLVLSFLAIMTVSALINTLPAGGPLRALTTAPALWITITLVQTFAVASSSVISATVARQNEERRRALEQLAAAQAENEGLQRQLLSQAREAGVLDERQRLSQEIHDTLAQGLTGIITQLEAAAQARENPAAWQRHLANATALARENLTAARRSVHALHPEPLDGTNLPDALADVSRRWSERTGVPAGFTTTGTPQPLHPEIEATLLRITQEALSNVDKHAAASRVGLTLSYMEDEVTLDVRDDGVGFTADRPAGFGLPGMRRRVQRLAGHLNVESEPGGGTAISANLPAVPLEAL